MFLRNPQLERSWYTSTEILGRNTIKKNTEISCETQQPNEKFKRSLGATPESVAGDFASPWDDIWSNNLCYMSNYVIKVI